MSLNQNASSVAANFYKSLANSNVTTDQRWELTKKFLELKTKAYYSN